MGVEKFLLHFSYFQGLWGIRERVAIRGTTVGPEYNRVEGLGKICVLSNHGSDMVQAKVLMGRPVEIVIEIINNCSNWCR